MIKNLPFLLISDLLQSWKSRESHLSLEQRPQTRGPRAACGPREGPMRPANSFQKQKMNKNRVKNRIFELFC
jgi:hypothetical protein